MRGLDGIMDISLGKLEETEGQENLACSTLWVHRVRHYLATEQQQPGKTEGGIWRVQAAMTFQPCYPSTVFPTGTSAPHNSGMSPPKSLSPRREWVSQARLGPHAGSLYWDMLVWLVCCQGHSGWRQDTSAGGKLALSASVQFSSVAQLCPTLCDPIDCSTPGFPIHHQLLELAQTHVH